MKKTLLLFVFSAFVFNFTKAQQIIDVQAYSKLEGSRFVALLSDQTIWWFSEKDGWQKIPTTGLPEGTGIKFFNAYVKFAGSNKNTRLVAVLQDNTMWWYVEGKSWEKVSGEGLPKNSSIKIFRPYVKFSGMGSMDTRFVVVLEDNSIYWFVANQDWKQVPTDGLPKGFVINHFGTYQKVAMMGTETRYIITLADNSIWWYADKNKSWERVESQGLPAKYNFKQLEAYMKIGGNIMMGTTFEGRLVGVLSDESVWWLPTNQKEWKKLEMIGLPKDYKIRALKVYQKTPGLMGETRVIVVLEDNSIWWYADGKNWSPVPKNGLPVS